MSRCSIYEILGGSFYSDSQCNITSLLWNCTERSMPDLDVIVDLPLHRGLSLLLLSPFLVFFLAYQNQWFFSMNIYVRMWFINVSLLSWVYIFRREKEKRIKYIVSVTCLYWFRNWVMFSSSLCLYWFSVSWCLLW